MISPLSTRLVRYIFACSLKFFRANIFPATEGPEILTIEIAPSPNAVDIAEIVSVMRIAF